jgi:hypothetical protein
LLYGQSLSVYAEAQAHTHTLRHIYIYTLHSYKVQQHTPKDPGFTNARSESTNHAQAALPSHRQQDEQLPVAGLTTADRGYMAQQKNNRGRNKRLKRERWRRREREMLSPSSWMRDQLRSLASDIAASRSLPMQSCVCPPLAFTCCLTMPKTIPRS